MAVLQIEADALELVAALLADLGWNLPQQEVWGGFVPLSQCLSWAALFVVGCWSGRAVVWICSCYLDWQMTTAQERGGSPPLQPIQVQFCGCCQLVLTKASPGCQEPLCIACTHGERDQSCWFLVQCEFKGRCEHLSSRMLSRLREWAWAELGWWAMEPGIDTASTSAVVSSPLSAWPTAESFFHLNLTVSLT